MVRTARRLALALAAAALAAPIPAGASNLCAEDCNPTHKALPQSAEGTCYQISATLDGPTKPNAVGRAQKALEETIDAWRRDQGWPSGWRSRRVRITAMKAKPQPYLRRSVREELYYRPDVVTKRAYTVCWEGVISPVVCTSGAKLCK